jgi:putative oxidoreductase
MGHLEGEVERMVRLLLKTDGSLSQLCLRVALGVVMWPHGAQKVLGWFGGSGFTQTLATFAKMGFPAWSTVLLMATEFLGSILLVLGFVTRLWATCIGIALTICMVKYHLPHGFFMNWFGQQQGEGFEYHLLVIGIVLALLARGGGVLSVDRHLTRR